MLNTFLYKYYNRMALNNFVTCNYSSAEIYFSKIDKLYPNKSSVKYNLAITKIGLKKYREAEKLLLEDIASFGNSYIKTKSLADLYYISGDFNSALKNYKLCKSYKKSMKDSILLDFRIENCSSQELYENVLKSMEECQQGMNLLKIDYEKAEKFFSEAYSLDNSNYLALNNLGVIYMNNKKDYKRAETYFRRSLELSDQPIVRSNLQLIESEIKKSMKPKNK